MGEFNILEDEGAEPWPGTGTPGAIAEPGWNRTGAFAWADPTAPEETVADFARDRARYERFLDAHEQVHDALDRDDLDGAADVSAGFGDDPGLAILARRTFEDAAATRREAKKPGAAQTTLERIEAALDRQGELAASDTPGALDRAERMALRLTGEAERIGLAAPERADTLRRRFAGRAARALAEALGRRDPARAATLLADPAVLPDLDGERRADYARRFAARAAAAPRDTARQAARVAREQSLGRLVAGLDAGFADAAPRSHADLDEALAEGRLAPARHARAARMLDELDAADAAQAQRLAALDTRLAEGQGIDRDDPGMRADLDAHYARAAAAWAGLPLDRRVARSLAHVREAGAVPATLARRISASLRTGEPAHMVAVAGLVAFIAEHLPAALADLAPDVAAEGIALHHLHQRGWPAEQAVARTHAFLNGTPPADFRAQVEGGELAGALLNVGISSGTDGALVQLAQASGGDERSPPFRIRGPNRPDPNENAELPDVSDLPAPDQSALDAAVEAVRQLVNEFIEELQAEIDSIRRTLETIADPNADPEARWRAIIDLLWNILRHIPLNRTSGVMLRVGGWLLRLWDRLRAAWKARHPRPPSLEPPPRRQLPAPRGPGQPPVIAPRPVLPRPPDSREEMPRSSRPPLQTLRPTDPAEQPDWDRRNPGWNKRRYGFRGYRLRRRHWERHYEDWDDGRFAPRYDDRIGNPNERNSLAEEAAMRAYESAARDLLDTEANDGDPQITRFIHPKSGDIWVYNHRTYDLVIGDRDGNIRSYFRATPEMRRRITNHIDQARRRR